MKGSLRCTRFLNLIGTLLVLLQFTMAQNDSESSANELQFSVSGETVEVVSTIETENIEPSVSSVIEEQQVYSRSLYEDGRFKIQENGLNYPYEESLTIKPLPNNNLLTTFKFNMESNDFLPGTLSSKYDEYSHYSVFPKSIKPLLRRTSTRQLHLRFTRGYWDAESWGRLPHDGFKSGGSGVELWAVVEASSKDEAYTKWKSLANSLSGLFCASINFVDSTKTTYPMYAFQPEDLKSEGVPLFNETNELYLMRAALANEPVCTENLTPFIKLLPSKGKSGVSSLLDGHKLFDSIWHNLAIDVSTKCSNDVNEGCHLEMETTIDMVAHVPTVLARNLHPIPIALNGDELRCDYNKPYDAFQCFPAAEETVLQFTLSDIFGKNIAGSNDISFKPTKVCAEITDDWSAIIKVDDGLFGTDDNCYELNEKMQYDLYLESGNTENVKETAEVPIYVSRSLTGYHQGHGGLRTVFNNPSSKPVKLIYFESLPWFMRIYLSSLEMEVYDSEHSDLTLEDIIESRHYIPASDHKRSTHLEFIITIPAKTTLALSYQFDKALLHFTEYPPDANHGFEIESLVITVIDPIPYQLRTSSLLLYLSTPDFSMPYNVIIITSTIMGLIFGMLFNSVTKRLVTVEEAEKLLANNSLKSKLNQLKNRILSKFSK